MFVQFVENKRRSYMEWINVKETLPKEGEEVLVFTKDKVIATGAYYVNRSLGHDYWLGNYGEHDSLDNVRYWMPLPLPPSKKNRAR